MSNILIDVDRAVARIALNRPDVRNALDEELVRDLAEAYARLSADVSVRVIVLSGAGPAFCAGADLGYMARTGTWTRNENLEDARGLGRMFAAIAESPKATIARVHSAAIGGGVGLLAACDIAIAADVANFAFSEARLGLAPATIAPYVIDRIGIGAARSLFVSGERFTAAEALRIGLIDCAVPSNELDAVVESYLAGILESGPEAIAATKSLLRSVWGQSPEAAAEAASQCIADLRVGTEAQQRMQAFLERRKQKAR